MQAQRIDHMFNFTFEKSSAEIVEKAKTKVAQIRAKVEERKERLTRIRAEYKITDAVLIDVLQQARQQRNQAAVTYTSNVRADGLTEDTVTVPAGVVQNILSEQDFISAEQAQAERLELIIRNLKDLHDSRPGQEGWTRGHTMTFDELKFLGF